MTVRQALLIAALFCAVAIVVIDLGWVNPDAPHLPAWLGLSLASYYGSLLVNR